jgi:hypothetical protein
MNGVCVLSANTPLPVSGRDGRSAIAIGHWLQTPPRLCLLVTVRRFIVH